MLAKSRSRLAIQSNNPNLICAPSNTLMHALIPDILALVRQPILTWGSTIIFDF